VSGVNGAHLTWLLVIDAMNLVGGIGALVAVGLIRSRIELVVRGGIALLSGMLVGGIVEAHLALIGVPISLGALAVIDLALVAAGVYAWRRNPGTPDPRLPRRPSALIAPVAAAITAVQLAHIAGTAAVRPMAEWDSWAIWAPKAHYLTVLGSADSGVFANRAYELIHLDYPILQPTLQALSLRGGWDPGMAHLQLVVLIGAALWATVGICHGRTPLEVPSLAVLFLAFQPWFVNGMLSGYADVPVAVVSACALLALLRFSVDGDRRFLAVGVICAGGAGLIKNEGSLFVLAAFVAVAVAILVAQRPRELRPLGVALAATVGIWLPWRLYVVLHNLPSTDYKLGSALSPSFLRDQFNRVDPATSAVWGQVEPHSLLAPASLLVVGLIAALLARQLALSLALVIWCALSFIGLIAIYWISTVAIEWQILTSVDRVTTTLLVGGVVAGAFGAGEAFREHVLSCPSAAPATSDVLASAPERTPDLVTRSVSTPP
jgi:hypothetical protein